MSFRFYNDAELPRGIDVVHEIQSGMKTHIQAVTNVFNQEKQLIAKETVFVDGDFKREYFNADKGMICICVEHEDGALAQQIQYQYDANGTLVERVDVLCDGRVFKRTGAELEYFGS